MTRQSGQIAQLPFNLTRQRLIAEEKISHRITSLPKPLALIGVPGPGLLDHFLFDPKIDQLTGL